MTAHLPLIPENTQLHIQRNGYVTIHKGKGFILRFNTAEIYEYNLCHLSRVGTSRRDM